MFNINHLFKTRSDLKRILLKRKFHAKFDLPRVCAFPKTSKKTAPNPPPNSPSLKLGALSHRRWTQHPKPIVETLPLGGNHPRTQHVCRSIPSPLSQILGRRPFVLLITIKDLHRAMNYVCVCVPCLNLWARACRAKATRVALAFRSFSVLLIYFNRKVEKAATTPSPSPICVWEICALEKRTRQSHRN